MSDEPDDADAETDVNDEEIDADEEVDADQEEETADDPAVSTIEESLTSIESAIDDLEEALEAAETEGDLDDLEDEVESVRSHHEDVEIPPEPEEPADDDEPEPEDPYEDVRERHEALGDDLDDVESAIEDQRGPYAEDVTDEISSAVTEIESTRWTAEGALELRAVVERAIEDVDDVLGTDVAGGDGATAAEEATGESETAGDEVPIEEAEASEAETPVEDAAASEGEVAVVDDSPIEDADPDTVEGGELDTVEDADQDTTEDADHDTVDDDAVDPSEAPAGPGEEPAVGDADGVTAYVSPFVSRLESAIAAVEAAELDPDDDAETIAALLDVTDELTSGVEDVTAWDDLEVREQLRREGFYDVLDHVKDFPPEWSALKVHEQRGNVEMVLLALDSFDSGFMEEHCLNALKRMGDPAAIEPMLALAKRRDTDAIAVLGAIGEDDEEIVETVMNYVDTGNVDMQAAAFRTLGEIGATEAVEPIAQQLVNDNETVRSRAARALGLIGDTRAIEPLAERLDDDESDTVRASAAWALRQIGTEEAFEVVEPYAEDRAYLVQAEARRVVPQ